MSDIFTTPHRNERQPGFGPREIDPPAAEGHEPDTPVTREELVAQQAVTDTMEAADIAPREDESEDVPVVQLGSGVGMPQAGLDEDPLHAADMPADEPGAYEKIGIEPGVSRP